MMKLRLKKGYSMLELAIVLAVTSFLLLIGARAFRNYLNQQGMNTAIEHTLALLNRARSYTLASFDDSVGGSGRNYGVHIDATNDTFTLFYSDSTCSGFSSARAIIGAETVLREVDIASVDFAGTSDIIFQRISGDAKAPGAGACVSLPALGGTVTLRSRNGALLKTVRVLGTGVTSIE